MDIEVGKTNTGVYIKYTVCGVKYLDECSDVCDDRYIYIEETGKMWSQLCSEGTKDCDDGITIYPEDLYKLLLCEVIEGKGVWCECGD